MPRTQKMTQTKIGTIGPEQKQTTANYYKTHLISKAPKHTHCPTMSPRLIPILAVIITSAAASCLPSAKTIKLVSTTSQEIGIFEIGAYDASWANIASQGTVTSSSTRMDYYPSLAIDGDTSSYFLSDAGDEEAWFQLEFEDEVDLDRVVIQNRWCGDASDPDDCLCKLSDAQLYLLDATGYDIIMENLQDTCGQSEITTDDMLMLLGECGSTPHDFGSVYDAIGNSDYNAPQAASSNVYQQHASDSPDLTKEEALELIEVLKQETIPHQCNVAITRDLSANFEKHPVVFCNFNIPIGLFCTAEIVGTACSQFTEPSKGEIYSHGVASAIFVPDIKEEYRMFNVYNISYCARIDVYYGEESIYNTKFPVDITYKNYEVDGKYGLSAQLSDEDNTPKFDGGSIGLGIMVGLIMGSIMTLAVSAMIQSKKRDRVKGTEAESLTNGHKNDVFTIDDKEETESNNGAGEIL